MELKFDMIGRPAYGTAFRTYEANIPLKKFTAASIALPLFVIPKGATVVAVKATTTEKTDASGLTVDVGTYAIADGAVGAVVDADALYAAAAPATTDTNVGGIIAAASTAKGLQTTQDVVVQAVSKAVTAAGTKGILRVEVVTLP